METLIKQMNKEYARIEMLQNAKSNGEPTWYDFVKSEVAKAKERISELKEQINQLYNA